MQEVIQTERSHKRDKVNFRHSQVIEYLLSDPERNATNAYLKVYPNVSYDTAKANVSVLLTRPNLKEMIAKRTAEIEKKSRDLTQITVNEILQKIDTVYDRAIELDKLSDANKSAELLGKYKGIFIDKSITLSVSLEDFIAAMHQKETSKEDNSQ